MKSSMSEGEVQRSGTSPNYPFIIASPRQDITALIFDAWKKNQNINRPRMCLLAKYLEDELNARIGVNLEASPFIFFHFLRTLSNPTKMKYAVMIGQTRTKTDGSMSEGEGVPDTSAKANKTWARRFPGFQAGKFVTCKQVNGVTRDRHPEGRRFTSCMLCFLLVLPLLRLTQMLCIKSGSVFPPVSTRTKLSNVCSPTGSFI